MRLTGFFALAATVVIAVGVIVLSHLRSTIPEPHASCVAAWRDVPDNPLRQFGRASLELDPERSRITNLDDGGERILSRVGPVSRSAGRPVTLECRRDADGNVVPVQ